MCEPVSASTAAYLSVASLVATAGATVIQMVGQQRQGAAQQGLFNYQAQVARNNQIVANQLAEDALRRGEAEEARSRLATRRLKGRQRTVLASNGVFLDEGSALDIVSDTDLLGEQDALTIRNNAEREAAGFRARAADFGSEAAVLDTRGRIARSDANFQSFGTLLTGIGSVSQKWYSFKKDGTL